MPRQRPEPTPARQRSAKALGVTWYRAGFLQLWNAPVFCWETISSNFASRTLWTRSLTPCIFSIRLDSGFFAGMNEMANRRRQAAGNCDEQRIEQYHGSNPVIL